MPDKISVLLVDDHSLVRRGFRRILEDESDIEVTGEAADGVEAVRLAQELQPNVVVMDCAMPNMNGLEATRKILQKQPQTLVLMLSMHPEETLVRQALDAGARGYVLKNAVDLELGAAELRCVVDQALNLMILHQGALRAGWGRFAGRDEKHVALAEQFLRAVGVEDDARVDAARNLKCDA